jgi:RNA polymerase sigma factor (sigma-70 family)
MRNALRTRDSIPTRYSLLSRLQDREDHDSWKDFFDTYWRLIYTISIRSGLTDAEAQDAVQETVITVARDIHKFKRDPALGSFKGWLRKIIHWRVADQFRKRKSSPPGKTDSEMRLEEIPETENGGLEAIWEQEWQANLFAAAVDRVKRRVKAEQFQIFDLYAVKNWPVLKVSRTMKVSIANIYLVKHRIAGLIKKEIKTLEQTGFGL